MPGSQFAVWLVAIVIGLVMGWSSGSDFIRRMPYNRTTVTAPYNDIAAFLEAHTEPGSIIGMTGGGNAGYFIHDRTVVNMDGLINSYEYFQLLKNREAGVYLQGMGMDYILANQTILGDLPYKGQFSMYSEFVDAYNDGKDLIRLPTQP